MPDSVKFTTTANEPTVIRVTEDDGKEYVITLSLTILDVIKLSDTSAVEGLPAFQAKACVSTESVEWSRYGENIGVDGVPAGARAGCT